MDQLTSERELMAEWIGLYIEVCRDVCEENDVDPALAMSFVVMLEMSNTNASIGIQPPHKLKSKMATAAGRLLRKSLGGYDH